MKKIVSLLILMGVVFTAVNLAGCHKSPDDTPVTFTVLYNERSDVPFDENWLILEEYRQRKNVVLDVQTGDDADFEADIALAFASGAPPDIILKVWPDTVEPYAARGLLLPFSDYEHLMPYYQAYIAENQLADELDHLRMEDGKYYLLPGYRRPIQVQQWAYRRDLFDKHNLGVPRTYEALFESLVTLKNIYPETTPITASWGGAHLLAMIGPGYGIPAGWSGTRYFNAETARWRYAPATENYHEMLRFLNRCYEAGILDPEIPLQSEADYNAKLTDGRALVTVTWVSSGFDAWNDSLNQNGIADGEWAPLRVPKSTLGITALPPVARFRKGLAVPARVVTEPYFEDLIAFLDWAVYSEEGMTLTNWGVENVTFTNTDAGKAYLPQIKFGNHAQGTKDLTADYGLDTLFNLNENLAFEDAKKPPEITAFLESSLQAGETADPDPKLPLDAAALNAAALIEEQLTPVSEAATWQFITGQRHIDDDWQAYILELDSKGMRTLEEIWQIAWQAAQIKR